MVPYQLQRYIVISTVHTQSLHNRVRDLANGAGNEISTSTSQWPSLNLMYSTFVLKLSARRNETKILGCFFFPFVHFGTQKRIERIDTYNNPLFQHDRLGPSMVPGKAIRASCTWLRWKRREELRKRTPIAETPGKRNRRHSLVRAYSVESRTSKRLVGVDNRKDVTVYTQIRERVGRFVTR